jgi:halogenation protein CepH
MNGRHDTQHDLIVLGAGPAGTTLATLVARAGHRVLLVERSRFPRYQIGESLLPATFNGLMPLLGIEVDGESLGAAVVKRGATFHWGRDDTLWTLNFGGAPHDTVPGPEWPTAFNVRRDVFDDLLLDAARKAGVEYLEDVHCGDFEADDERVRGVQLRQGEHSWTARATWLAGATGQFCPLAPLIAERQPSAFFRNAALFGYFEGGARLPPPLEGNVLLESFADGWIWYIPLSPTLTSVGVVLHHPATERLRGDRESLFAESLARCPYAADLLKGARRVETGQYAGLRLRSEFSYSHARLWKPGALLVGDSACFVDVVLSSGVHLATFGALQAARAINSALAGDFSERLCMNEFELRYRLEFTKFYLGLLGLHDMQQDGATYRLWLRRMLRETQGVYFEEETEVDGRKRDRSWRALALLRQHNTAMLARMRAPRMDEIPAAPDLAGELTISADGLRWAQPPELRAGLDNTSVAAQPGPQVNEPLYDYGKLHVGCAPYLQAWPDSPDGALALVEAARARSIALRVRGSGHTFSGASLPRQGEVLVRTQGLDHFHFCAPDRLIAGAGALVWDVRDLAREHGYDLPVFNGGWAGPTLAGYICAGGFGKSGLSESAGGLWENVHAVRLIDGHGKLRRIARGDEAFPWLFGSSGQLGLMVDAELRLVPYADHRGPRDYPLDSQGRVPRRQVDDPAVNAQPPPAEGEERLFWFTLLAAPEQEDSAWQGLLELVLKHRAEVVPDGGWAGPLLDGQAIGYRYVIRFHEFNPPLVYPRAETFLVLGVMCKLRSGDDASNARVLDIERSFIEIARARRLRLYLQAENIGRSVDLSAYYGRATYTRFMQLKREFDPAGMFNRGVVFDHDAL